YIADLLAAVFDTVDDRWPAIVFARQYTVDLVTPSRTELGFPQVSGNRDDRESLDVAVTVRIQYRTCTFLTNKRVCFGRLPVGGKSEHIAQSGAEILRLRAGSEIGTIAGGDELVSVFRKFPTAAIVQLSIIGRCCLVNNCYVMQLCTICSQLAF